MQLHTLVARFFAHTHLPTQPPRAPGKDGTKEYLNVGHSASAHKILTRYPIGTMADPDVEELEKGAAAAASSDGSSMLPYVLAVLALLAALAYQFYFKKQ